MWKRHGQNQVLDRVNGQQRKSLLKDEAKRRASGDWGPWEHLSDESDLFPLKHGMMGWVTEVTTAHRNKVFCVLERHDSCGVIHAAVVSLSQIRPSWYEMQRIKDELFGEDRVAVEVYPKRSEIVDGSDTYHFWVLPEDLPFGLTKLTRSTPGNCPLLRVKAESGGV